MRAASELLGFRGPIDVDDAPAFLSKIYDMMRLKSEIWSLHVGEEF